MRMNTTSGIARQNSITSGVLKNILCSTRGVKFSYIIDGTLFDFMSEMEIYSLFGNALDNALEGCSKVADPARRVVVVSAAGKRSPEDHKLTDLLYLCYAHLQYGVSCDSVFQMIADRYVSIRDECGLSTDIESELAALRAQMERGI